MVTCLTCSVTSPPPASETRITLSSRHQCCGDRGTADITKLFHPPSLSRSEILFPSHPDFQTVVLVFGRARETWKKRRIKSIHYYICAAPHPSYTSDTTSTSTSISATQFTRSYWTWIVASFPSFLKDTPRQARRRKHYCADETSVLSLTIGKGTRFLSHPAFRINIDTPTFFPINFTQYKNFNHLALDVVLEPEGKHHH